MLFRTTIFAALLLGLVACNRESYSRSTSGFSSRDKKLLYDFRAPGPNQGNKSASGADILATYDLDGDGKNELLLESVADSPGRQIKSARLATYDKDKLITVEDFGQVYDSSCGAPDGSLSASTIYYLPPPSGQKPRFTVELYRAPCPTDGKQPQWTQVNPR
jgi:hypothetical protein